MADIARAQLLSRNQKLLWTLSNLENRLLWGWSGVQDPAGAIFCLFPTGDVSHKVGTA